MTQYICSKMFTDLNIRFTYNSVKNCCKTQDIKLSLEEIQRNNVFIENSEYLSRKADMLFVNQLPELGCATCVKTEPNSLFRTWNLWKEEFTPEEKLELYKKDNLTTYELVLSSACDLKCIYCGSKDSSSWAKELREPIRRANKEWEDSISYQFTEHLRNKTYDEERYYFFFSGGEPTYNPDTLKYIRRILKFVPKEKIVIIMSTNINTKDKVLEQYLNEVRSDRNVRWVFDCSLDGLGDKCEAIRTGISWDRAIKNIKKLIAEENIEVRISPTVNLYSLPHTAEFVKYFYDLIVSEYEKIGSEPKRLFELFNHNMALEYDMSPLDIPSHYSSYLDPAIEFCEKNGLQYADHLKNIKTLVGNRVGHDGGDAIREKFEYFKRVRPEYDWDALFPHVPEIIDELDKNKKI